MYILFFIQYRMDIEYLLVVSFCNSCHNSSLPDKALYMTLLCWLHPWIWWHVAYHLAHSANNNVQSLSIPPPGISLSAHLMNTTHKLWVRQAGNLLSYICSCSALHFNSWSGESSRKINYSGIHPWTMQIKKDGKEDSHAAKGLLSDEAQGRHRQKSRRKH